jgi:SAM-dependent methyltransferase
MDVSQVRSVAWLSLQQVADDLNDSFAPGEGAVFLTHRLLADNRRVTSGLTGGALVCGDMASEQAFFDQPWSNLTFNDVHGYDLSQASLDRFTTTAFRWHPHVVDCNHLELQPGSFDLLVASHGAHHVANLDNLFSQARQGLRPGGLMYIYEWIGPTYLQIPRRNRVVATALLLTLFPRRATRTTHAGKVKGVRYLQDPPESFDPSEACNALELRPRFVDNFDVLREYQHGGLTYPMFEGIAPNIADHQPRTRRRVAVVLAAERLLTRLGVIHPLFTVAVGRRRPPATDQSPTPGAVTATVVAEEIQRLTDANRAEPSVEAERHLVDLRHRAFFVRDHTGDAAPNWPPPVPDLFAGVDGLPEIPASELNVDTLRAGILGKGSLIVRGLLNQDQVDRLRTAVTASMDAYDAHQDQRPTPLTEPWFHPLIPVDGAGTISDDDRYWVREGGGVLVADSPRSLFELLEVLDETSVIDIVTAHLGETPALSVKKTTLRDVHPVAQTGWHQDGAFLGADVRSVNVWIALSHCGEDAPSMDIVARRLDHIVTPGVDGALFNWSVSESSAEQAAGTGGIVRPVFAPGDVILFDQMNLHRTAPDPDLPHNRLAIEAWLFAPSRYPIDQIPITI